MPIQDSRVPPGLCAAAAGFLVWWRSRKRKHLSQPLLPIGKEQELSGATDSTAGMEASGEGMPMLGSR